MRRVEIDASLDRVAQDWSVLRAAPDLAVLPRGTLLAAAVLGTRAEVVEGVGSLFEAASSTDSRKSPTDGSLIFASRPLIWSDFSDLAASIAVGGAAAFGIEEEEEVVPRPLRCEPKLEGHTQL